MKYESDFEHEKTVLENILDIIQIKIGDLTVKSRQAKEHLEYLYKAYVRDPDLLEEIPVAEELNNIYANDLERTMGIQENPYFGKIIFSFDKEKGKDATLYLGKKGIEDYIIDWRAPISDVYYSGKMGNISYEAPEGRIGIDLKLKSTLKIRNKELLSVYDSEMIVNDDLLTEYLSQSKSTVLNEIIATIQEEQNIIIRKKPNINLIVQGVAGSGKTTVALHRISYLLYNYKDITFENIYLIAGNKLFLNYITAMLPDLDVPVIKQGIMQDIFTEALADYNKNLKIPQVPENSVCDIYDNHTFIEEFKKYIKMLENDIFPKDGINLFNMEILSGEQINYYIKNNNMSLFEKAQILDGYVINRIKNYKDAIIGYISNHKNNKMVTAIVEDGFGLDKNSIFEEYLYKNFSKFSGRYNKYFSKKLGKIKCEDEFRKFTGREKTFKQYTLNDLACMLLFFIKIKGCVKKDIRHVVIDEAQDFGTVIYYCLKNLFPDAYFTIVGDIMQNINHTGLDRWDTVRERVFDKGAQYSKLLKSYRNTVEISNFAESLMRFLGRDNFEIEPLLRHGQPVSVNKYSSEADKLNKLVDIIKKNVNRDELCAIICKDNKEAERISKSMKGALDIALLDVKENSLHHGIYSMSVKNSKGLEFDSVIIWDFDDYIKESSDLITCNSLYVAVTRALHSLYIFSNEEEVKNMTENVNV